jgi:predicted DNA-binding transcriptional regulator AlpA
MTNLNLPLRSPKDVSELLGVSTGTLRSWRERGDGPQWLRVGKLIKYAPSDIESWVASINDHRDDLGG